MAGVGLDFTDLARAEKAGAHPARTRPLHGTRFAVATTNEALGDEWAALADRAEGDNVFFDPAFVLPAVGHLHPGVQTATVRTADGRLIAAAPFARTRLGRIAPA